MLPGTDTSALAAPPADGTAEVSVFGRACGESAVVHLGDGDWAIVDSFRSPVTAEPVALDYLHALGVDVATRVRVVLATHWHWDHIDGIAAIVKACPAAAVFVSGALHLTELLVLAGQADLNTKPMKVHTELRNLVDDLAASGRVPPVLAGANLIMWRGMAAGVNVELLALSPSSASVIEAFSEVGPALAHSVPEIAIPESKHNRAAIVAHLTAGCAHALLCSDLERAADVNCGWGAAAAVRPKGSPKATLIKIAHHGSPTGEDPRIWTDMLDPDPVAVVTRYHGGRSHLPPHGHLGVLNGHTAALFSTSRTSVASGDAFDRTPFGKAARGAAGLSTLPSGWGHVRARGDMAVGDPWRVAVFDDGNQLHP